MASPLQDMYDFPVSLLRERFKYQAGRPRGTPYRKKVSYAAIGFAVACFSLGYMLGKDMNTKKMTAQCPT